jgi:hypothetical protein
VPRTGALTSQRARPLTIHADIGAQLEQLAPCRRLATTYDSSFQAIPSEKRGMPEVCLTVHCIFCSASSLLESQCDGSDEADAAPETFQRFRDEEGLRFLNEHTRVTSE